MISVLLNWTYIFGTTCLIGFGLGVAIYHVFGYDIRDISSIIAIGIVTVTIYAQIFSLFYNVGVAANLVLVAVCLSIAVIGRHQIVGLLAEAWKDKSIMWKLVMMLSVIIWCFCTSRGYMHYDSDLYHAQSIRWIEE